MIHEEFEREIIEKARKDEKFKQALVNNPKETLARLGVKFSAEVEVKVVEESSRVVYLVLPVNLDQLTEEQLKGVSGGFDLCSDDIYVGPRPGCWTRICWSNYPRYGT